MKRNKAAAADRVKAEVQMQIGKKEDLNIILTKEINQLWIDKLVPNSWKEPKSSMIKKCNRLSYKQLRPTAVTRVESKLVWGHTRGNKVECVIKRGLNKVCQTRFIKGCRIKFNLSLLHSIVNNAKKEWEININKKRF